jgi:hypothetical protein
MTLYLDLPDAKGKLDRLIRHYGARMLPGPPRDWAEVPQDKALLCVSDMGEYEAAGYINTEQEFLSWTGSADHEPRSWLLLDRETADRLCPAAAEHREHWRSDVAREAEAAAHADNLIPVARASRSALRRDARLLRGYASALRDADSRAQAGGWPVGVAPQPIAAADLDAIAHDLETWAGSDWIAVIDLGPEREHLAGPLPPFPAGHSRPGPC